MSANRPIGHTPVGERPQPAQDALTTPVLRQHAVNASSARSGRPARHPGRKAPADVFGWKQRGLSRPAVLKAPKPTGSCRRLSPSRLDEQASALVSQAVVALRAYLPVAWVAVAYYDLDTNRPPGAQRGDSIVTVCLTGACMAVSSDYRSGRRARPGRQVTAAVIGKSERTVERAFRVIEARGLAYCTVDGVLLTAEQREAIENDPELSEAERERWVNRREWHLVIPAWVQELTEEQLLPYVEQARALIGLLAAPALSAVDNRTRRAVDNPAARDAVSGVVAPSNALKVLSSLQLRRSSFLPAQAVDNRDSSVVVEEPQEQIRATPWPSPTRGDQAERDARARRSTGSLAAQLIAEPRLPFLAGADYHQVRQAVSGLVGWTVPDVLQEIRHRLAKLKHTLLPPDQVKHKALYLRKLLEWADPSMPPATIDAALAASAKQDAARRMARLAEQAQRAVRPAANSVYQQAKADLERRTAEAAAEDRRLALARSRRERNERLAARFGAAALPTHVSESSELWPEVAQPGSGLGR